MNRIAKALILLSVVSSGFGCAVTRHHSDVNYRNLWPFSHHSAEDCLGKQPEMAAAPSAPVHNPLADDLAAARAENDALKQQIADLQARPPEKEIVEVPKEVIKEVQLPGKELKRYVISTDLLFETGKDILTDVGKARIDEAVKDIQMNYASNKISVEGHTDTDPIVVSGWKSNWELGAARALAVLHYLEDNYGINGKLLSATTYSYNQPAADNDSAEGKAKNRRAEIVIYVEEPQQ